MIFYFSATGNGKYVATRIADATNDRLVSITDSMNNKEFTFSLSEGEAVGIISPTYAWGLPIIVCEFLDKLKLSFANKPYVYFIATYGTTPGQTGYFANQFMKEKGISFDAQFGVKMPDTWTPTFNLSNKEKVSKTNANVEPQVDFIIHKVKGGESGDFMKHKMPLFASKAIYNTGYNWIRRTKNFNVEDTCVGCGLCQQKCPVNAIEIRNGKPHWTKDQCVMCLGCLHHCPKFAIQYGKKTKKHGQYTNPNVRI